MRVIAVMGGVISGVGKGIASASIAKILQENGFSVTAVKIDPYINYDAGTMRPTEHGEVWVTDDGGEIDQDLGNYERFLGYDIPKSNCITTGQVYWNVIEKERRGEYLGKTVQFIPHIIDEIKNRIKAVAFNSGDEYDFVVVEVGGTIGDYENVPFMFALRSLSLEKSVDVINVLVSYLPIPENIGEMKTKPTQQSIKQMSEHGMRPDFVLCRASAPLDDVRKKKIEKYANIDSDFVISAPDVSNVYQVPLNFERERLGEKVLKKFGMWPKKQAKWAEWRELVENISHPANRIKIGMVGKYIDTGDFSLADSYISVNEALRHAGAQLNVGVDIDWIDAKEVEAGNFSELKKCDGIIVPGGFGSSGIGGKIAAIRYAREQNVPYLGLCYGMQLAIAEFARNAGMESANTTEVDKSTDHPVIDILPSQKKIMKESRYGASMRLGAYAANMRDGRVLDLYRQTGRFEKDQPRIERMKKKKSRRLGILHNGPVVLERHRHRYEVNPDYVKQLEKAGLVFSGWHVREDGTKLMEFIELSDHKYFIATQAHPEFKSRLGDPSPLFFGLVEACAK